MSDGRNDQTANYIERLIRLWSEKQDIAAQEKDIYVEAKSRGEDLKVLRTLVADEQKRMKEKKPGEYDKFLEMLAFQRERLAGLKGTPLGDAALADLDKRAARGA